MGSERDYWLAWSGCPGVGPVRFGQLLKIFKSAKEAWEANATKLQDIGFRGEALEKFLRYRREFSWEKLKLEMEKWNVDFITREDEGYPSLLKEINNAPFLLYVMGKATTDSKQLTTNQKEAPVVSGKLSDVSCSLLAVVGTRKITQYGIGVTKKLVEGLVDAGLGIISGCMYGVDEVAHRACVAAGGYTVGVWAGGLDTLFKGSRKQLAEVILNPPAGGGGTLISEFPLGMQPSAQTFPYRNRIVAGMSRGVLVTEGSEGSGTLITAGYAAEQGKEIFAVPGPITSQQSAAPAQLIKAGAKLVTSVQDILDEIPNIKFQITKNKDSLLGIGSLANEEEKEVLELLKNEEMSADELARKLKKSAAELGSCLTMMEIKGWVRQSGELWGLS